MNKNEVIQDLIFLPVKYANEDKSPYALVKESGYFEFHDEITEKDIFDILVKHPELVQEWVAYSEDQRMSPVWYIHDKNGQYYVSYYSKNEAPLPPYISDDLLEVCAVFIKRKSEQVRLEFLT
ncbi:hypothetical protein [Mucilaginibacter celer]|uniref:Uncharacterized protein n=1 Tax=Mucilaginibacter celer TaxID=2305508 RepID=A0A494VJB1_9SPHI|nr:hypothetical protein [Mucilaginibacter celer]AYL93869.1 hypothetical protein HYN43_000515 [Mucilaginibacter celer]